MKWIVTFLTLTILALAVFGTTPTVNAVPNFRTPTPAPSGTPISVGTTPHP